MKESSDRQHMIGCLKQVEEFRRIPVKFIKHSKIGAMFIICKDEEAQFYLYGEIEHNLYREFKHNKEENVSDE